MKSFTTKSGHVLNICPDFPSLRAYSNSLDVDRPSKKDEEYSYYYTHEGQEQWVFNKRKQDDYDRAVAEFEQIKMIKLIEKAVKDSVEIPEFDIEYEWIERYMLLSGLNDDDIEDEELNYAYFIKEILARGEFEEIFIVVQRALGVIENDVIDYMVNNLKVLTEFQNGVTESILRRKPKVSKDKKKKSVKGYIIKSDLAGFVSEFELNTVLREFNLFKPYYIDKTVDYEIVVMTIAQNRVEKHLEMLVNEVED